jgi:hypothetical protein
MKKQYIYICSAGHSGSTLLDHILGSHDDIFSLGEIINLSKNISMNTLCTCGMPIKACTFWQEVLKKVNYKLNIDVFTNPYDLLLGYPDPKVYIDDIQKSIRYKIKRHLVRKNYYLYLNNYLYIPKLIDSIKTACHNTYSLYDSVLETSKKSIVVDSSKYYLEGLALYNNNSEKVKIILLVRNGYSVYYSYLNHGFKRSVAVNAWKNHYKRAIPLIKNKIKQKDVLLVKYENMTKKPNEEINRICKFIGIKYDDKMLGFSGSLHHSVDGNDMRFKKNNKIKYDNRWEKQLKREDKRYFDNKAKKINRILGY